MSTKTVFHNPAILLIGAVFVFFISCKSDNYQLKPVTFPAPVATPGCAHYANDYSLPQTQPLQQLSEYMSSEHFDYDLDG